MAPRVRTTVAVEFEELKLERRHFQQQVIATRLQLYIYIDIIKESDRKDVTYLLVHDDCDSTNVVVAKSVRVEKSIRKIGPESSTGTI